MTLEVRTARISYGGPDRLDITRAGNDPLGVAFAPSEALLRLAKTQMARAAEMREQSRSLFTPSSDVAGLLAEAARIEADAWALYEPAYLAEMRVSYGMRSNRYRRAEVSAFARGVRPRPEAWRELLLRARVVAVCYCVLPPPPAPQMCHRRLWAGIMVKFGAADGGEL